MNEEFAMPRDSANIINAAKFTNYYAYYFTINSEEYEAMRERARENCEHYNDFVFTIDGTRHEVTFEELKDWLASRV